MSANSALMHRICSFEYSAQSIGANTSYQFTPNSNDVPNGYKIIALYDINTGSSSCALQNYDMVSGKMRIFNVTASAVATVKPSLRVVCIKSDLVN